MIWGLGDWTPDMGMRKVGYPTYFKPQELGIGGFNPKLWRLRVFGILGFGDI